MDPVTDFDVAIVGGGFAGAVAASRLLADGPDRPLRLALLERQEAVGHGVAYGTSDPGHLLNLPAGEMSASSEAPDDFTAWLAASGHPAEAGTFAPRGLYGAYVASVLARAVAAARPGRSLTRLQDEAVGLLPTGDGYRLRLASGHVLQARQVVLAVGQFPPVPLRVAASPDGGYIDDPWSPAALAPMPAGGAALLVGTGLTAVDVALSLLDRGATQVTMVSRRAQLPAAQREGAGYRDWLDPETAPTRVSQLWRRVRQEIEAAEAQGSDWRSVIDALKPHVPALWRRLPLVERRRFLRHARSHWEAHRNRLPPATAARVALALDSGRLAVASGRLRAVEAAGAALQARLALRGGGEQVLTVARVVNCTGPDTLFRRINHPLVLDVIGTGLGRPDPIGLGLDTTPEGRLKDEDGAVTPGLYTLGWPRIGALWEATTVPSLREQAREVAALVLRRA